MVNISDYRVNREEINSDIQKGTDVNDQLIERHTMYSFKKAPCCKSQFGPKLGLAVVRRGLKRRGA